MVETVFLFGAGASYGAGPIDPEPPPLGGDLFDKLQHQFPGSWGSLPPELKTAFSDDFEYGMEQLSQKDSKLIAPLYREMAVYFVCFAAPDSDTLYDELIIRFQDSIENNEIVFSTLNYECVFEECLVDKGYNDVYFEYPTKEPKDVNILKLHGSCNFVPSSFDMVDEAGHGLFTEGMQFEGDLRVYSRRDAFEHWQGDTALYPAMALIRPDKYVQVGAEHIQKIQRYWVEAINEAEQIAIIGVNPQPHDTHIWDKLAEVDAQLLYIGGQAPFEEWCEQNRPEKTNTFIASRFDDGLAELCTRITDS